MVYLAFIILFLIIIFYISYGIYYIFYYLIIIKYKKLKKLKLEKIQIKYKKILFEKGTKELKKMADLMNSLISNNELPYKTTNKIRKNSTEVRLELENYRYTLERYRKQQPNDWNENNDLAMKCIKKDINILIDELNSKLIVEKFIKLKKEK